MEYRGLGGTGQQGSPHRLSAMVFGDREKDWLGPLMEDQPSR